MVYAIIFFMIAWGLFEFLLAVIEEVFKLPSNLIKAILVVIVCVWAIIVTLEHYLPLL
jgi:hypothetical protein